MEEPNAGPGTSAIPPQKPAHAREFTWRAVIAGLLVAAVIGASYPYIVLKLGFGPNISVVAAFFGFLALGLISKNFHRWENNLVQTAGTTAGQIAFMCWLLAAFDMLADDKSSGFDVRLTRVQTFLWFGTAGVLGVFLAVPLRRHFIIDEKLPFPDGIAAGETLILLDSAGPQARKSAFAMVGAMAASALNKLGISLLGFPERIAVAVNSMSAKMGVGFSLELLSLGSGMIIGIRVCSAMLVGTLLSWVILPPLLRDGGVVPADAAKNTVLLWVMWPATGLLVAGGLTALFLKWKTLVRTFQALRGASVDSGDFPMKWVVLGALASAALLVVLQKWMLGTPVWHSLLAIVLSLPLMLVALRVLGETNWGPISTMTNVMQAIFGAVAPGNLRAGMVSSGITGSVAAESEGLIQDYKTGDMIGSTPRYLTYMQLMAVPVGALMLALIYPVLRDEYGFTGDHGLVSPASQRWVGFATILSKGFSALPPSALMALGIGAVLGVLFTILEQKRAWKVFVPSPTGLGIGMLISAGPITTIFVGACIEWIWRKLSPESARRYAIPVASGLIAGEAIIAVLLAICAALGWWSPPA